MKITSKTRTYYCDGTGWHYHRDKGYVHRITGPAYIGSIYYRVWYHENHDFPFQKTGPGHIYLNGVSGDYHINGASCLREEYDNYIKSKKL